MAKIIKKVSIYGGGSWGCALACQVARVQEKVQIFLRNEKVIEEIKNNHTNARYLDDIVLCSNIYPTANLADIINSELIIIAVPSYAFSAALNNLKLHGLKSTTILLIATKGISKDPIRLLSEELKSILSNPCAFISGPNFAKEVAKGLLTPVTIAAENFDLANEISHTIKSDNFITSITSDIITVQIAGAIKNIIAIRSGMYKALGFGENAKAGLITEGLKDITILSQAMGGRMETLFEVAVLGDLMLTCYSETSRNTKFGYEFAKSENAAIFLENYPYLIEGRESIKLILQLSKQYKVELHTIAQIAQSLKL
ncbi:MAG: NAD(P)H-dependent glycerol-3-phosphate dehydrogenase [Janthinobacterium lividum]